MTLALCKYYYIRQAPALRAEFWQLTTVTAGDLRRAALLALSSVFRATGFLWEHALHAFPPMMPDLKCAKRSRSGPKGAVRQFTAR